MNDQMTCKTPAGPCVPQPQPAAGGNGNGKARPRKTAAPSPDDGERCRVISFKDGQLTRQEMLLTEAMALPVDDVDFYFNDYSGLIRIDRGGDPPIEHFAEIPGEGDVSRGLRLCLMADPGILKRPSRIAHETRDLGLVGHNNVAARLTGLRRGFGESGDPRTQRFFKSRRRQYAICWAADRTYRMIQPPFPPGSAPRPGG